MGYAHFYAKDLKSYIKEGAKIGAGTVLFPEGNQGNSSGPHLHFQINKGSFNYNQASTYDPTVFMKDRGVTLPAATY
jgi:murein DD-endopeptidase MepM/ murein hydrolase activator NlpD